MRAQWIAGVVRGCAPLIGLLLLALAPGCVVEQAPRVIEGSEALATARAAEAARPRLGTADAPPRPPAQSPATARRGPRRSGPVDRLDESGPDRRGAAGPRTPAQPAPRGHPTTSVKKAAADEKVVVPSPSVIPPPSGEQPIDLATALRLADVANPDDRPGADDDPRGAGPATHGQDAAGPVAQRQRELPRPQRRPPALVGQDPQPLGAVALPRRRCLHRRRRIGEDSRR